LLALNTSIFIIDYSAHGAAQDVARRKNFGYRLEELVLMPGRSMPAQESYPRLKP
jgi:hypothetical protein